MTARRARHEGRGLVMPPGRSIPRSPGSRPTKPDAPGEWTEIGADIMKSSGELVTLATQIRACTSCERACPERAFGTGFPRAPVMLVKEHPSSQDLEAEGALTSEAEALAKAFEALAIPISWVYGATAVRCGDAPATRDQMAACAKHLLVEIEAVLPRVLVAFGEKTTEGMRALDGRCGIRVPEELPRGQVIPLRSDLVLLVTEPLPDGVTQKDSKKRLWQDLQRVPDLIRA